MASTGPEFKMTAANPTQDEFKKLTSYCSRKYTASTDIVWADDMGETLSLENFFFEAR